MWQRAMSARRESSPVAAGVGPPRCALAPGAPCTIGAMLGVERQPAPPRWPPASGPKVDTETERRAGLVANLHKALQLVTLK